MLTVMDDLHKQQQQRIDQFEKENEALRAENRMLQQKIDLLVRKVFGTGKSERFDPGQMELGLKGEDTPEEPQPLEAPAASGGKHLRS